MREDERNRFKTMLPYWNKEYHSAVSFISGQNVIKEGCILHVEDAESLCIKLMMKTLKQMC